jgi:hypothetical protein
MSKKELQRELLRAVVDVGILFVKLVGAHIDAHMENGVLTKKIARFLVNGICLVAAILMWLVAPSSIWK